MSEVEKGFRPVDYDPVVDSLFVSVPDRQYKYSIMVGDEPYPGFWHVAW